MKKVHNTYYAYYATTKRVPEKKYPVQVIKGLAGKIDESGFHPSTRALVDIEHIAVRECGFSNYLLRFEDEFVSMRTGTVRDAHSIFRSVIVYLSNSSYLGVRPKYPLYSAKELEEKFQVEIPQQMAVISKLANRDLAELEPLKYICNVLIGNRTFYSELTERQKQILEELGIDEAELREEK